MRELVIVSEWCNLIVIFSRLKVFMSILLMFILPFVLVGESSLRIHDYVLSIVAWLLGLFELLFAFIQLKVNFLLLVQGISDFIFDLCKSLFHSFIIKFLLSLVAKHWDLCSIETSDTLRELFINLLHSFPLFESEWLLSPSVLFVNLILVLNKFVHLLPLLVQL